VLLREFLGETEATVDACGAESTAGSTAPAAGDGDSAPASVFYGDYIELLHLQRR
jgi:hypothetical protein